MSKIVYRIIRHDGAWAYEANGTISERFPTREAARSAARLAAREQLRPGESTPIDYEDERGSWHHELADGHDRPKAVVKG
jgi:hypothetical protein